LFNLGRYVFVKFPMFLLHFWLPKVHVEAPVEGSIILAGILIKIGGYGLSLLSNLMFFFLTRLSLFLLSVEVCGLVVLSTVNLFVKDVKKIIAYSSVVHMCLAALSYSTFALDCIIYYFVLFFAHGVVSPLMFRMID